MKHIGAVLLTGGKSRRMGQNKALLTIKGQTFLEHTIAQLADFDELFLSASDKFPYLSFGLPIVEDLMPDCGPMGGLYSSLCSCQSDWLLAVSCDMPLLDSGVLHYLLEFVSDAYDAFVITDRSGRIHPLCAVYSKKAAAVFKKYLSEGNYRLMAALESMRVKYVPLSHSIYPDTVLSNTNTPEDYAAIKRSQKEPAVLCVCGVKNSGKTTLLERLLPLLSEKGLKTAVIKHDGHDFIPDVPGTDSYRMQMAGAFAVGVFSSRRAMTYRIQADTDFSWMISKFPEADLILIEGGKNTGYPKLEIVRSEISDRPIEGLSKRTALCTDLTLSSARIPVFSLDAYREIADFMEDFVRSQDNEL